MLILLYLLPFYINTLSKKKHHHHKHKNHLKPSVVDSVGYPTSLPDANGDSKSDVNDWFVSFRNMYMNQYDIN